MKKTFLTFLFIAGFIVLSGCMHQNKKADNEEIMNIDKAFSKLSEEKGMKQAFLEYAAEDAVILRENSYPQVGKNAMAERFKSFSDTGFILTWEPLFAEIASSGDLGYSYGIYTGTSKDSLGSPLVEKGTYVSIWKKDNDGKWKFILDTGNEGLGEE
jgi:ketosteroid isomerase-like protein